jgi:methyl-accepting chemotaxis protein
MQIISLGHLRLVGMRVIAALIAALALLVVIATMLAVVPGKYPAAFIAIAIAILPCIWAAQGRTDAHARMLASVTGVVMPALLLYVCDGFSWQVDLHMIFFAQLAAVSILCDWKAICAAAVVVAVHHIGFGLLLPNWIFSGGGSIGRIGLHAVVLVVEALTLMWIAERIVALIAMIEVRDAERQRADEVLAAERLLQVEAAAVVTGTLEPALAALAAGELNQDIMVEYPAGYGSLRRNFNDALASLRNLIGSVTDSAEGIRTGSIEIAQASEDLARRTEGNAASLEQTSAALAEIEVRLKTTAQSSRMTVDRADQAIATVGGGRTTADEAVRAMLRVSESAKGIDGVIEGLDKIAFQTRVLAMNAAVEAGRAGDAGRGFAVVADLVSALAMRAEEEAKRARDQLSLTQSDIATAMQAVEKVDNAFDGISGDVAEVHKLLGAMANDSIAQSSAISQITQAIATMDQSTQQNAAMVEETSAAARNLTDEVTSLADNAAQFRIGKRVEAGPVHFRPSRETLATRAARFGSA